MNKVNHPAHYERFRVSFEPADISAKLPHPLASAFEYILRAPYKNGAEDYRKAEWWLHRIYQDRDAWGTSGALKAHYSPEEMVALLCKLYLISGGEENEAIFTLFKLDRLIYGFDGLQGYALCTRESVDDAIEILQALSEEELIADDDEDEEDDE